MNNEPDRSNLIAEFGALLVLTALPAAALVAASIGLGWLLSRLALFDLFQASLLCLIALAATIGHFLRAGHETRYLTLPCTCLDDADIVAGIEPEPAPTARDLHIAIADLGLSIERAGRPTKGRGGDSN